MDTTVLPFIIRPGAQRKKPVAMGEATVIIFPGVRYEPPADEKSRRPPKRADGAPRGKGKRKAQ